MYCDIFINMKQFIKDLFSEQTAASSKRVIAIFIVLNLIGMTWIAVTKSDIGIPPQFMFDALALVAAGGLGLTAVERIFSERKVNAMIEPPSMPVPKPEPTPKCTCTNCNCQRQQDEAENIDI